VSGRLNVRGPTAFCDSIHAAAADLGCDPSHVLQADARVIERLGLHNERRSEVAQILAEGALLRSFGGSVGGARSKRGKRPKP
jgi:hypothetical protein